MLKQKDLESGDLIVKKKQDEIKNVNISILDLLNIASDYNNLKELFLKYDPEFYKKFTDKLDFDRSLNILEGVARYICMIYKEYEKYCNRTISNELEKSVSNDF